MNHTVDKAQRVVGFLFRDSSEVALIIKTHPTWQAGKLNGIGGKIEDSETPLEAMQREFLEETGAMVEQWRLYATLHGTDSDIYCFVAHGDYTIRSMTDEVVGWYDHTNLTQLPIIADLTELIPLALASNTEHTHLKGL